MKNIHVVIVTGQAQANLIPILQLKPDAVALVVSDDMKQNADGFKALLNRLKPNLLIQCFEDVPSIGLPRIKEKAMAIYQTLKTDYPDSVITYHATGGNKLMMLGFHSVFAKDTNVVIYNHTDHGEIEILYPENTPSLPVEHLLNAKNYLQSLGFNLRNSSEVNPSWTKPVKEREELTYWLANNADLLNNFFGELNGLIDSAMDTYKRRLINPEQRLKSLPSGMIETALEKLNEFGICVWSIENPKKVYFKSISKANYLSGGWLEEYVWLVADNLGMNEVRANVRFSPLTTSTVENEMDAIIVHNNRLLAIECKTASLERDTRNTNNILYKLEALSKIGGLYHTEWLVSARPIPADTQTRADNSKPKIKIISPAQLKNLKSELEVWRDAKH